MENPHFGVTHLHDVCVCVCVSVCVCVCVRAIKCLIYYRPSFIFFMPGHDEKKTSFPAAPFEGRPLEELGTKNFIFEIHESESLFFPHSGCISICLSFGQLGTRTHPSTPTHTPIHTHTPTYTHTHTLTQTHTRTYSAHGSVQK